MSDYYTDKELPLFANTTKSKACVDALRNEDDDEYVDKTEKYGKGKAQKLLAYLINHKECHTTELVENVGHRFSASMLLLRNNGHKIATLPCTDGRKMAIYRYVGKIETQRCTKTIQDNYYASEHWITTRERRKAFDGYMCCICHSQRDLQVHHWRYELFAEKNSDLMTLCNECHRWIHDTVHVSFPRNIASTLVSRLTGENDEERITED